MMGWVVWAAALGPGTKMLYNYPGGEDRMASSGLGTHSLWGSEIAGAPTPDWRGQPEGAKVLTSVYHFHWSSLKPLVVISLSSDRPLNLSHKRKFVQDRATQCEWLQQGALRLAEMTWSHEAKSLAENTVKNTALYLLDTNKEANENKNRTLKCLMSSSLHCF